MKTATNSFSLASDAAAEDFLEALVAIQSHSREEIEAARFLVNRMRDLGFEAQIDGAGNPVGRIRCGDPTQAAKTVVLLGHIDTVQGGPALRRDGRLLFGRGSVDAKGPLCSFVAAAARLAASEDAPNLEIIIIGCVEEEVTSSKGARYVEPRYRPDYLIVGEPSGWNAVTLGYKGYLKVQVSLEIDTAHSAGNSESAASILCLCWQRIHAAALSYNADQTSLFASLLPALNRMQGGPRNSADWAELDISLRLPPQMGPAAAAGWLAPHIPTEARLETRGGIEAWTGPRTTELHRAFAHSLAEMGEKVRYLRKTGTADLNIAAPSWGCPALAYGPGDSALDHRPDEHIHLDEYLSSIQVLIGVLRRVAVC